MGVYIIVGTQWRDEGKGKVVIYPTYQGGLMG